jgi:hypothetical protein
MNAFEPAFAVLTLTPKLSVHLKHLAKAFAGGRSLWRRTQRRRYGRAGLTALTLVAGNRSQVTGIR